MRQGTSFPLHKSGFLTIELLTAIFVIATVMTSSVALLVQAKRQQRFAMERHMARNELANLAEEISSVDFTLTDRTLEQLQLREQIKKYCKNIQLTITAAAESDERSQMRVTMILSWQDRLSNEEIREVLRFWKFEAEKESP